MNIKKPKIELNDGDIIKTRTRKYKFKILNDNMVCYICALKNKRVVCNKYKCHKLEQTEQGLILRQGIFEEVE